MSSACLRALSASSLMSSGDGFSFMRCNRTTRSIEGRSLGTWESARTHPDGFVKIVFEIHLLRNVRMISSLS